jgi:1-acyl-sn-glycerol-3-phosphate acyltransferase
MDHRVGPALIEPITAEPRLGIVSRLVYRLLLGWFRGSGWRAAGTLPADRKFVIVGASHTSNWDFPVFLGTVEALGRRVRFIGKDSLFRWPIGGFMRALGGDPVSSDASQDLVAQVVAQIAAHKDFA